MARFRHYFYIIVFISCQTVKGTEIECPKLCQCENSEDTGLKIKCNVKEIKEIAFTSQTQEVTHL